MLTKSQLSFLLSIPFFLQIIYFSLTKKRFFCKKNGWEWFLITSSNTPNAKHMEDEDFKNQLDELFQLFKKLIDKQSLEGIPGVDQNQIEQLKQFLSQYDDIKNEMSMDMIGNVDPMSRQLISVFIKQLREQLGDAAYKDQMPTVEELVEKKEEEVKTIQNPVERYDVIINTIDEQLKKPNLSDEEVNILLDRRAQIVAKKQQSH
jgi:hypothetical protein